VGSIGPSFLEMLIIFPSLVSVRDRGSNMSNLVNNIRLKLEAQGKA